MCHVEHHHPQGHDLDDVARGRGDPHRCAEGGLGLVRYVPPDPKRWHEPLLVLDDYQRILGAFQDSRCTFVTGYPGAVSLEAPVIHPLGPSASGASLRSTALESSLVSYLHQLMLASLSSGRPEGPRSRSLRGSCALVLFLAAGCFTTSSVDPPASSVEDNQPSGGAPPVAASTAQPACVEDRDCFTTTAVCVDGQCLDQDCQSLLDCPTFAVCDDVSRRCVECVGEAECASSETCVDHRCVARCVASAECPGQVCNGATGKCEACSAQNACPDGQVCTVSGCEFPGDAGSSPADGGMPAP